METTMAAEFVWYFRSGVDPDTIALCSRHAGEVEALGVGYKRGRPSASWAASLPEVPDKCAVCNHSASLAELRDCRCNVLGVPCPVHRPGAVGAAGEVARVQCIKCGAAIGLPADRVAFEDGAAGVVAVDITGWARRQGSGDELLCPFHGPGMVYYLAPIDDVPVPVTVSDDEIDEVLAGLDCMLEDPRAWLDPVPEAELDDADRAQLAVVERLRERLAHELTAELRLRGAEVDQVLTGLRLLGDELARSPVEDGEDFRLRDLAELVARLDGLSWRKRRQRGD